MEVLREMYFQHLRYRNRAVSHIESTKRNLKIFYRFLNLRSVRSIGKITSATIEDYKRYLSEYRYKDREGNWRPLSKRYQADQLIAVKVFFKFLAREDVVAVNPVEAVRIPNVPEPLPRGIMTPGEVRRVLDQPNLTDREGYRDRTILEVFYSTGIRNSELCRLKVADVDFESGVLKIFEGKGCKDRMVPLSHSAMRFLKRYIREIRPHLVVCAYERLKHPGTDGTLFVGKWGAKLDAWAVEKIVSRSVRASKIDKGVPITPHSFRHTIATHLLQNGMDIRYVQEFLGHASIGTTQRYTRVNVADLKKQMKSHLPPPLNGRGLPVPDFEADGRVTYGPYKHKKRAADL